MYEVKEKAHTQDVKKRIHAEQICIEKMVKIEESKMKRHQSLQQEIEKRREKYFERKDKQAREYLKKLETDKKLIDDLRVELEHKSVIRIKPSINEDSKKLYWKELHTLTDETQRVNIQHQKIIQERKRERVLNMHSSIGEKNMKQARSMKTMQCMVRTQSIKERERKEKTLQLVEKMADTENAKCRTERRKLEGLIHDLNSKFDLGLNLTSFPASTRRSYNY